jgi:hypothetical protein
MRSLKMLRFEAEQFHFDCVIVIGLDPEFCAAVAVGKNSDRPCLLKQPFNRNFGASYWHQARISHMNDSHRRIRLLWGGLTRK